MAFMLSVTNKLYVLSVVMLNVVMLSVIMLNVIMLSVIILNVFYAECHFLECRYAECHYIECRYVECHGALKIATPKALIWGLSYKNVYGCNLQIFVISYRICPQQAFPA
jgi:hypothetical protein